MTNPHVQRLQAVALLEKLIKNLRFLPEVSDADFMDLVWARKLIAEMGVVDE